MIKNFFFLSLLFFTLLLISCSSDDNSTKESLEDSDIKLNIRENDVISSEEIILTISNVTEIISVKVYLDNNLANTLTTAPYTFSIDSKSIQDGKHILKIEILTADGQVFSKSVNIKTDNNGPTLSLEDISDYQKICDLITIKPKITDLVSKVSKVKIYINDQIIPNINQENFSFDLNPSLYESGNNTLKFEMEDEIGNISKDSINVDISKRLLNISFPDDFTRIGTDKVHIILSDAEGNFIDSKTHQDKSETLFFCMPENFSDSTEFTLTFVTEFENVIFNFYVYSNLTKSILGDKIEFNKRPLFTNTTSINIDTPFVEHDYYMRASGPGYSAINIDKRLTGHFSRGSANDLNSEMAFIQYFNENISNSYRWAFLKDIDRLASLKPEDLKNDNVINKTITINGSNKFPFLSIKGFENEALFNVINGHLLYWNPSLIGSMNTFNYSYADIFYNTVYSFSVENYATQGIGLPPSSINVPNLNIDYSFANNTVNFTGVSGYEVGRMTLENYTTDHIRVELIFNGQSNKVVIPNIPPELFNSNVADVFNNQKLSIMQGMAEDYSSFSSYEEYLKNVLVPSKPFYISSPQRHRIFKSSVGPNILPVFEFPYSERF